MDVSACVSAPEKEGGARNEVRFQAVGESEVRGKALESLSHSGPAGGESGGDTRAAARVSKMERGSVTPICPSERALNPALGLGGLSSPENLFGKSLGYVPTRPPLMRKAKSKPPHPFFSPQGPRECVLQPEGAPKGAFSPE